MGKTLIVERDVEMLTRDGVTLRADVYRPQTATRLPVLLQRTPYGKAFSNVGFALMAAERGYAVVIQDTRGRWASEGTYYPFLHERTDGYDAVEWAAHQPWADGLVVMFGGSYVGYTQFAAAALRPPALKTIVPAITFCDPYRALYTGGALQLGLAVSWVLMADVLVRVMGRPPDDPERARLLDEVVAAVDGMVRGETFEHLPPQEIPLVGRSASNTFVADALLHPTRDDYWERLFCPYETLTIPMLHIGGWYDAFAALTLGDYAAIRRAGNTRQHVLMGPWYHGPFESLVGAVDFGLRASSALVVPDEAQLRWFDHWLKGVDNGVMDEPPIQAFTMGTNGWRSLEGWPPDGTRTPLFLHSGGAANSLAGDGRLTWARPGEEPADSFVYDPRRPVPTRGGGLCCHASSLPAGAFDQREVERRSDVLVYSTPPLERDMEVTGPVELHLWVSSTARDTDLTAKLVDVGPCGFARNLSDGILRARFRDGHGWAAPLKPDHPVEMVVDLGVTSNVFRAGHSVRLEVSSSNFPRFDRNPNTGRWPAEEKVLRPALQTVWHDADHPSHLVLPVVTHA